MTVLGATRDEILFVAFLVALTLIGTYVGTIGKALSRVVGEREPESPAEKTSASSDADGPPQPGSGV